jgi:hypothetical protein
MGVDFQTFGEALVQVEGGSITLIELGYCSEPVHIEPRFAYKDVPTDDFPIVPSNRLWMLAETKITMTLVYYDPTALEAVILASMGGGNAQGDTLTMAGAGTPMGVGILGSSDNPLMTLTISSNNGLEQPYIFDACHLAEMPVRIPIGVERSLVQLTWSSIPYFNSPYGGQGSVELISANSILWRRGTT